jgi:hypothetical protein
MSALSASERKINGLGGGGGGYMCGEGAVLFRTLPLIKNRRVEQPRGGFLFLLSYFSFSLGWWESLSFLYTRQSERTMCSRGMMILLYDVA